jgi:hypothetical protein
MSYSTDRRQILRTAAMGVAGAAAGVVTTGSAAQAAHPESRSPAGSWLFDVTAGTRHEQSMYSLTADGSVIQVTDNGVGVGTWRRTGPGRFAIGVHTWLTGADGKIEGSLRARLDCSWRPDGTLTAVGRGAAYDPDGTKLFDLASTATGTRFGIDDL